jgi:Phytanoyl-CoA dioxygenase (PhyH)
MELTHAQKQHFVEHGYVKIPGVVPRLMVETALRAINCEVGQGMNVDDMPRFRAQSFCPPLRDAAPIAGLFNATPLCALAESMIGAGKIKSVDSGQIALRFPALHDPPPSPRPHLDGMYSPTNGVPQGQILNFTMLAGVFLSDVPGPFAGNFTVWPGTHRLYEAYFREHGPQALLEGMPPVELPEPCQITAQAGDAVLAHYELGHGVAANVSPHVRYAIFFRLTHVDHAAQKWEAMQDIWLEYEGLREFK